MRYVVLLLLAAGGWAYFYAAAAFQYDEEYAWANQTCSSIPYFCDSPYLVFIVAIAAAIIVFAMDTIRS